jgi:Arc/MetJ family transcription regulator
MTRSILTRGLRTLHSASQNVGAVQRRHIMRTNIVIDDKLMKDVLRATGLKTKREAVDLGLRTLLRLRQEEQIRRFRGKLRWEGDLDAMRTD